MKLIILFLVLTIALTETKDLLSLIEVQLNAIKESLKDKNIDPMILKDRRLEIDDTNLGIKLDANIDGQLIGLFGIKANKFNMTFTFKFDAEFELPELNLDISSYDFEGWLGLVKIFGKGTLSLKLTNTIISVKGGFGRKQIDGDNFLFLRTIDPKLNQYNIDFEITGYLNDDVRSTMISKMVNEVAPILIDQNIDRINKEMEKILMKYADGILIPSPI